MHKQFKFWVGVCLALLISSVSFESEAQAGRRNRIMQTFQRQHAAQTSWNGVYGHQHASVPALDIRYGFTSIEIVVSEAEQLRLRLMTTT